MMIEGDRVLLSSIIFFVSFFPFVFYFFSTIATIENAAIHYNKQRQGKGYIDDNHRIVVYVNERILDPDPLIE